MRLTTCFLALAMTPVVALLLSAESRSAPIPPAHDLAGDWSFTRKGGQAHTLEGTITLRREPRYDDKKEKAAAFFGRAHYVDKSTGESHEQDWVVHVFTAEVIVQMGGQVVACQGKNTVSSVHFVARCTFVGIFVGELDASRVTEPTTPAPQSQ